MKEYNLKTVQVTEKLNDKNNHKDRHKGWHNEQSQAIFMGLIYEKFLTIFIYF